MRDDRAYLDFVLVSIGMVRRRIAAGREVFDHDDTIQDAVLRRLEVLTDAAAKLSPELKERHPEIAWTRMSGFRNRIAHGYLDVDLDLVWEAIETDLPLLEAVARGEVESKP
jgi:uncharacterized protein with HEPN domain